MMNQFCFYVVIVVIVASFGTVHSDPSVECPKLSNSTCEVCLKGSGCGYCKENKACFDYKDVAKINCNIANIQVETCVGSFKIWIIIISVVGGILLIAIFVVVCCICRKCKNRSMRKEQLRQDRDEQRMEERRVAAEVRAADRTRAADQIRMKYGILKEKENNPDYKRMP